MNWAKLNSTNEELIKKLTEGNSAIREELLKNNLPLITEVIWLNIYPDTPNIKALGMSGLKKAVYAVGRTFNIQKAFAPYAIKCIRRAIEEGLGD